MKKKTGSLKSYNPRKSKKHIFFFNVVPVALSAAVLLGIAGNSAFRSVDATAKTSLLNIEAKKSALSSTGGSFRILEVTPKKDNALYRTTAGGGVVTSTAGKGNASTDNYDAVTGNFGYLIGGQEPIDFDETLKYFSTALISDSEKKKDYTDDYDLLKGGMLSTARTKWANQYLNALKNAGIASEDKDSAPLKLTKVSEDSYYKELMPWDPNEDGEKTISLNSTETVYVKGRLTQDTTNGSYSPSASSYKLDQYGSYLQNISMLNPLISADSVPDTEVSDYVFYQPVFKKVDFSTLTYKDVKGDLYTAEKLGFPLIFSKSDSGDGSDTYAVDQLATGKFSDFFTKDEASFKKAMKNHTFDDSKDYYVVTGITGSPVIGSSLGTMSLDQLRTAGYYAAKLDTEIPYVAANSLIILKNGFYGDPAQGLFSCNPSYVNYVGKGRGSYNLTFDSVADSKDPDAIIINYSIIRYVGGYKNNNWFLKHTLDVEDKDADSLSEKVYVDCVKPEDVSADSNGKGQSQKLDDYDLIVLSGGLDVFSNTIRYRADNSYSDADCSMLKKPLQGYLNNKGPLVVDSSALANSDIKTLLSTKESDTTYNYMDMSKADAGTYPNGAVYRSVYVFRGNKALVSDQYINNFSEDQYKEKGAAFYDVYNEIAQENALRERKNPGTSDIIDNSLINEATGIRYIINYAQQRVTKLKSSLNVLDIEPESITKTNSEDGYSYYKVSNGTAESVTLSDFNESECKEAIEKCLPDIDKNEINVTTISTRTLAGLTDDITENYDLVYIGDYNGIRKKYWDSNMYTMSGNTFYNSLVYYNIGDEYYVPNNGYTILCGMLDKEYNTPSGGYDTYRYSGNDISVKKQKELESFIKQGFPVIVSDGLIADTSHDSISDVQLGISDPYGFYNATASDKGVLSIKVTPQFIDSTGQVVSVKNASGEDVYASDLMKCHYELYDKYNKKIAESDDGTFKINQDQMNKYAYGNDHRTSYTCKITSATIGNTSISFSTQASKKILVWFNYADGQSLTAGCWSGSSISSNKFTVPASQNTSVSKTTIDNNTRLYETLDKYFSRGNVMSYSKAKANPSSVEGYSSLSSPEIYFDDVSKDVPAQYSETAENHNILSDRKLDFKFRIINETDINPNDTTYTAKVYADLNGDGVYDSDSEEITSLTVNRGDENGSSVLPSNLKGGINANTAEQYYLSAQLPESLKGGFSWKLVIYENGDNPDATIDECPRDSYNGISFVGLGSSNKKISIRILQLNSNANTDTAFDVPKYNLEKLMQGENVKKTVNKSEKSYKNWFGIELTSEFIKKYYDLSIKTIYASEFDDYIKNFKTNIQTQDPDWYKANKNGTWMDYYDMLILGFGDSYKGPDEEGLKQVGNFIDYTGKAVLFCHDNSGYVNLNEANTKSHGKIFGNQFYYNTILRKKSYMDVYGITDSDNIVNSLQLGGQSRWGLKDSNGKTIQSGILAKAEQITTATANAIKELGYSVAYKPVSGGNDTAETTPEVHGYTDTASAHRVKYDGSGKMTSEASRSNITANPGDLVSTKVNQINKGQITSYPYNINTGEFNKDTKNGFYYTGSDQAYMNVCKTHAQWFQLNTNSDNIVVWYTVENNSSNDDLYGYNDCINNYYIYNCGNITYTGAGHCGESWEVTEEEAKLFVNTMIAAFRTSAEKPSAAFYSDEKGTKTTSQMNIEAETGSANGAGTGESTDDSTDTTAVINAISSSKIYFKINDNTISKNKTDGIYLYNSATAKTEKGVTTYTVSNDDKINISRLKLYDTKGTECQSDNLKSGKVYYFYLPSYSKAYADLVSNNKDSAEIWLVPYNNVGSHEEDGDPVRLTVSLTKTGLFDLG